MVKIYLSSTYSDLVDYREAAYKTLRQMRHDVIAMEDYVATDQRPLEKCVADVAECDVYVGIFAWRYGYNPPGQEKSITELELKEATRLGKPRLIFLLDEEAPWPPREVDANRGAIDRLRSELKRDYLVSIFTTAEQLATKVSVAISAETDESARGDPADEETDRQSSQKDYYQTCLTKYSSNLESQIRFYSQFAAALCAVGFVVSGASFAFSEDDVRMVAGIGGMLIAATTVFPASMNTNKRQKKALLDGFEEELAKESPAPEALDSVRRFLDHQLNLTLESGT